MRARAGTGKTTTIKAAFSQAPEAKMLYVVFNKKNQREAAEKIKDRRVEVLTLHSLGFRYIKAIWPRAKPDDSVEWDRVNSICGESAPDDVCRAVHKLVGFGKNSLIKPSLEALVDLAELHQIEAEGFEEKNMGGWVVEKLAATALRVMEVSKKPDIMNRISFNDMVWLPVAMNWVRACYNLAVVDEAQDMNPPQLEMARKSSNGRVGVVGDDRQAIYIFRGAMHNGIDMMKDALQAEECGLTITYRCPKSVVSLVNKYVPDFRAAPDAPEGSIVEAAHDTVLSAKPGDAILSRANAPLMPICLKLLRKGVSARIEGRDIGAMLLKLVEKMKAKSVPDYIAKVQAHGDRAIARLKNAKNSEAKIEAINDQTETLIAIAQDAKNVQDVKDRCIALFQDSNNNPKPAVVLSSVHKAKGLEWSKVFLIASTFLRPGRESREEENIFYVAATRTKNELVFVADPPKES